MADLLRVLPDFPTAEHGNLVPALERHHISVTDLLTLDAAEIGKRTHLPILDIKLLTSAVLAALHQGLGVAEKPPAAANEAHGGQAAPPSRASAPPPPRTLRHTPADLAAQWSTISTLDDALDAALGGGVPTGYVTEVTGESGAGKTQFLMALLLAVQLPPPRGLARPALYISTETPLNTRRLSQMLHSHPVLLAAAAAGTDPGASLDGVLSPPGQLSDLEAQQHILTYQVPVEVERRNIGLLVLDSVAANYRAELARGAAALGERAAQLAAVGSLLRALARRHNLAVVVANQVADRFGAAPGMGSAGTPRPSMPTPRPSMPTPRPSLPTPRTPAQPTQESPLASRSRAPAPAAPEPSSPPPRGSNATTATAPGPLLDLDHQQRWFTGWGDEGAAADAGALKTPSLGLVWTTQLAMRLALVKTEAQGRGRGWRGGEEEVGEGLGARDGDGVRGAAAGTGTGTGTARRRTNVRPEWRRFMKVVFAPHVPASGAGLDGAVEFEIVAGGLRAMDSGHS